MKASNTLTIVLTSEEIDYLLKITGRSSDDDIKKILTKREGLSELYVKNAVKFHEELYSLLDNYVKGTK